MNEREIAEKMIKDGKEMIEDAEKRLKALDKPQPPRYGAHGIAPGGMHATGAHAVLYGGDGYWRDGLGRNSCHWNSINGQLVEHCGNIFDDFKRNQGGLRQFTLANDSTKSIKVKWMSCDSHVEITQPSISWSGQGGPDDRITISHKSLVEFHQQIGRLIATKAKNE